MRARSAQQAEGGLVNNSRKGAASRKNMIKTPRMIKTKFAATCKACKIPIPKGNNVYYFPANKSVFCLSCGHDSFQRAMESEADWQLYQAQNSSFYNS